MSSLTALAAKQPKTDRFLLGILGAVFLLLLVAVISVVMLRGQAITAPPDSPTGTVQRFYLALNQEDYNQGYDLLNDQLNLKFTRTDFASYNTQQQANQHQDRLTLINENIDGNSAVVTVNVSHCYTTSGLGAAFRNPCDTFPETFRLQKQYGKWLISDLSYRYRPYQKLPN